MHLHTYKYIFASIKLENNYNISRYVLMIILELTHGPINYIIILIKQVYVLGMYRIMKNNKIQA